MLLTTYCSWTPTWAGKATRPLLRVKDEEGIERVALDATEREGNATGELSAVPSIATPRASRRRSRWRRRRPRSKAAASWIRPGRGGTAGSPRHQQMPILGLKPTPCDDIGVVLRTLKTRACVSMDIRVDLAKETARPRHFFRRRKNDPAGRETTPKRAGGFGRFRVVDGSEGCRRRRP